MKKMMEEEGDDWDNMGKTMRCGQTPGFLCLLRALSGFDEKKTAATQ